jgi:hypothetical protein
MAIPQDLAQQPGALEAKLDELAVRNIALERENKILREENAVLKLGRFGRSSERLDPGQLALFLGEEPAPSAEEKVQVPEHERAKRGHGRAPFADHLPRVTIECDVPESERTCDACGKTLRPMGEDVSERGHVIPARVVVNRYVRKKYACPEGHRVVTVTFSPS